MIREKILFKVIFVLFENIEWIGRKIFFDNNYMLREPNRSLKTFDDENTCDI